MALKALDIGATWEYISKADPAKDDPENATVFVLQQLDSRVVGKLRDKSGTIRSDPKAKGDDAAQDFVMNMGEMNFQTCQFGIVEIRNFLDKNGQPVELETKKHYMAGKSYRIVHEDVLSKLAASVIREVGEEVRKENELDEDDAKN